MNIQISLLERDAMLFGRNYQRFEGISCPIFRLNGTMNMEAKSSSESLVPIYQTKRQWSKHRNTSLLSQGLSQ